MGSYNLRNSFKIYREKLANGLDVVFIPINKAPVVCVNISYRVGSKDERFDRTGMAHLFEHLMFEGTKTLPKGEFDRLCSLAGGSNNAFTSFDMTNYYMTLPANQLDLGLWLESDRLKNFFLNDETLINQKDVVIEEIKQTVEDQPYGLWRELMSATAYSPESSYSWEVHGTKEHVALVNENDAENFRKMYYQPGNACLVITGDFQVSPTFEKVKYYFSDINKFDSSIKRNIFSDNHLLLKGYQKFSDDVPAPGVFVGYHCKGFVEDESSMADILANIIGVGRSSRLWRKLVEEEQIASQTGAYIDKREDSSLLILYALANSPDISCDLLKEEMDNVAKKFLQSSIPDDELTKSHNQLASQLAFEIQSITGLAEAVAVQTVFKDDPEKIYSLIDTYLRYNKDDVLSFAESVFSNGNGVRIDGIPED